MFECFDVRMFGCLDVLMFGCFDVRMFWFSDVLTLGCFNVRMFWCSDVLMFRCFDVRMFSCSAVLMSGCSDVLMFGCSLLLLGLDEFHTQFWSRLRGCHMLRIAFDVSPGWFDHEPFVCSADVLQALPLLSLPSNNLHELSTSLTKHSPEEKNITREKINEKKRKDTCLAPFGTYTHLAINPT